LEYVNVIVEVEVIVAVPKGKKVTPEQVENEVITAPKQGRWLRVNSTFHEISRREG